MDALPATPIGLLNGHPAVGPGKKWLRRAAYGNSCWRSHICGEEQSSHEPGGDHRQRRDTLEQLAVPYDCQVVFEAPDADEDVGPRCQRLLKQRPGIAERRLERDKLDCVEPYGPCSLGRSLATYAANDPRLACSTLIRRTQGSRRFARPGSARR
jgi:hypothetical protein